ncbi:MAG TPA: DUF177 domain-containing protein [Candidatus Fimenecus excrementigallinarum]|uniref:DUF177 domain-containing protein n=1 Tax=Candidatus Fimenecus excrementigallinarum TaxID=2840816 RepID=A0A9D1IGK9_9FIRM|nr:DUF177 domain-containing protein [Candidatus Fimenecus excrementigallinarum]
MVLDLEPVFNNIGMRLPFAFTFAMEDVPQAGPVTAEGAVENRAGVVTFSAAVSFVRHTACDRCLKALELPVRSEVSHVLVQQLADEADDAFVEVPTLRLDADALLREDILLLLPTKTLCRPDCKGLCPQCGADLNETDCGCKKPVDSRLAVLQQLLTEEPS